MLGLDNTFSPWKAAAQQLFYYIRPQLDRMLGEGILMLVLDHKIRPGKAAAQQLFYYIWPHWTGC